MGRIISIRHILLSATAAAAFAAHPALADTVDQPSQPKPVAAADTTAKDADTLSFHGITLYGTVDLGLAYLTHGAPLSQTYGPGLPFMLQKLSNRSTFSVAPNGLSQSKIGLSGKEPLFKDVAAIFKLETGFQPTSGRLTDGPRSLIVNNGRPLDQQVEAGDSSRAGQPFQGAAYLGLQSKTFGTLTFGRQTTLTLDNIAKYDPQAQSQAFSPIGYSGVAGGAGDTEDSRLDDTLKYAVGYGVMHVALLHQFGQRGELPGGSDAVDVGAEFHGLSLDASYDKVQDAVSASSLTAAQAAAAPDTLAATVSDNKTWSANAKYVRGPAKFYAGYENIEYENPSRAIAPGTTTVGGYLFSVVNNTNYTHHKVLQISWVGLRYSLSKSLDVTGAYYRYDQNSYKGNGCSNASASSCSGQMNAASIVLDERLTKRFDIYGGVNYSADANGLASGFLNRSVIAPMAGARFNF